MSTQRYQRRTEWVEGGRKCSNPPQQASKAFMAQGELSSDTLTLHAASPVRNLAKLFLPACFLNHRSGEQPEGRSYEAREIDQQPTKHLGPQATQMERRGKRSRIGDENRQAYERNRKQSTRQRAAKNLADAIAREEAQASTRERPLASNENRSAFLNAAQDVHRDAITQLNDRYGIRLAMTEEENRALYGKRTAALKRELEEIKTRFEEGGMFYHLTRAKADRQRARELQLSIHDGETRAQDRIDAIQHEYEAEKLQIDRRYEEAQRQEASRKLQRDFPTLAQQQENERDAGRGIDRAGIDGSGRGMDKGSQLRR